ncbi:MAG: acetolactate synthase large subunit, partial [Propionibacteriales bacterium]|nr:acetolactate synthase large subunit [Propionibacteriales bacterium]
MGPKLGRVMSEQLTGAQSLVRALEHAGVDTVFGIPGGAILPVYDPLFDSKQIRHILVRHEQGAGHAAEGYAMVSGKVGVCMATSGPGATNLVTAIADAQMDSVPIVAITGQVASGAIGTDAFQEADIRGITMPITKHSYLVTDPKEIPRVIAEAFHIASTGRPGPVLVDIAKDAMQKMTTFEWPTDLSLPGYRPTTRPHGKQVREAARLMIEAKRPVLYVGGGVIKAGAAAELKVLAEMTQIPVVTTLMARGAFPDSHELHLGMPGMHGTVAAVGALQKSDLLISLGARFDDRVTGQLSSFAPGAKVIHADIDPAEISKNRTADVPIVGDCREVIADLIVVLQKQLEDEGTLGDYAEWKAQMLGVKARYPLGYDTAEDGSLSPQQVIQRIGQIAGPEATYVAGVGQHQMWAAHFISFERPNQWLNSGGLGTMGFGVPAAMGAQVALPGQTVWSIDGDGCFQMTNQELATCAIEGIPIKVAVINNSSLGMVRQWQTLFYNGRYSNTDLNTGADTVRIPDFVKLAEAYGCVGLRCESV